MAVDFFEEKDVRRSNSFEDKPRGLIGLVLKSGLAKNRAGAERVLLIVLVLVLLATAYVLLG